MPGGDWTEIERLVSEQKYRAALEIVEAVLGGARQQGDDEEWARALIQRTQLRVALGEFATAVEELGGSEWPSGELEQAALELFRAHSLGTYLQSYSWEIRQRERTAGGAAPGLERWTADEINAEANRAFARAWSERASWGTESLGRLARYLEQNDYPARIRGTLRDAVTYLWAELLADSSQWRPEHASGVFQLDLEVLLAPGGERAPFAEVDPADPEAHPLLRLAVVLDDLETWHAGGSRPEAALEARLELLRRLYGELSRAEDRARLRTDLERALAAVGPSYEWWSMGVAQLARWVRDEERPEALVDARALALQGLEAHPQSVGGKQCRRIVRAIEAPDYSLAAMSSDAPGKRSLTIDHKNLPALHLRAYRVDPPIAIVGSTDSEPLPDAAGIERLVAREKPVAEWSVELPTTADYRRHRTHAVPPITDKGLYVVVASADRRFGDDGNKRVAVNLLLTDLVLLSRLRQGEVELTVRSGTSGAGVEGAEVELYRFDYREGHRRIAAARSDRHGVVDFGDLGVTAGRYLALARSGADLALDTGYAGGSSDPSRETTAALVYTDRSVYRPQQEVRWKLVAYADNGGFRTLAGALSTMELFDANGETVAVAEVETNEFGSAAGSFRLPAGRLLGEWVLVSSLGGSAGIRVEEYKRPTFEVTLEPPAEELRLNRPATFRGEARYYFGLPLAGGEAAWRVSREPVYPRFWSWAPEVRGEEILAAGVAKIGADGRFELTFDPVADERDADAGGVTYRYRLSVDVTDDGGETRSAAESFRLGFVGVEATIETGAGFLVPGEPSEFEVRRTNLDGAGRAGRGEWRLLKLVQPERALLPADQPLPAPPPAAARFATPGDRLRPRWAHGYSMEKALELWPDGAESVRGELEHGEDGRARLELPPLAAGAYRLRYSTRDRWGAEFEVSEEVVVAADGDVDLALPAVLLAERRTARVGETARLLVHSGLDDQPMMLELFRGEERIERRRLDSSAGGRVVSLAIGPEHRGGFGYRLTSLRDHQLVALTGSVFVPWDDRRLEVSFASFRDLLRPGGHETWRIRLGGDDGEALAAGSAELLAYMYDRSLDLFAPHQPPDPMTLYPVTTAVGPLRFSLGRAQPVWTRGRGLGRLPSAPRPHGDRLKFFDGYPIGGLGRATFARSGIAEPMAMAEVVSSDGAAEAMEPPPEARVEKGAGGDAGESDEYGGAPPPDGLRSDFSETAFWEPHLLLGEGGGVEIEFTVPDSVTEWSVWVHALTEDLRSGSLNARARTVKELLVRPYLPRFLREGDAARLSVVVNNSGETRLEGVVDFEIEDAETGESLLAAFGLAPAEARGVTFSVEPGGGAELGFDVRVPPRLGPVAFRVTARAGDLSDGELRPLPVLPGRMHLAQSRFATLIDADRRVLEFAEMAADDDPTRIDEQLVVTVDAQLFQGVLKALPYLASYPYECTEQLLNRFLSTGIVSSLFMAHPEVASMAEGFAGRETPYEAWAEDDPNRRMALEETPWLVRARGGDPGAELIDVLDPRIAGATRDASLAKLEKAQTASGGFPWWPGGPPSPYMTLYLLQGFSRALEFDVEVPRDVVERAWSYMHEHYVGELVRDALEKDCCWEVVTLLNYVLSSYPDASWTGGAFSDRERARMLDFSFSHWRRHSPLSKAHLALTLVRAKRPDDARLVFDSVMDSARTGRDEGTYWAPEERSWLWYNDRIETHAFALRTLTELDPDDERRHGLVQWLFLNKKLNQWKSTRATAEVVYALVHYLEREGTLAAREEVRIALGPYRRAFEYEPRSYGPVTPHGRALAGGEVEMPPGVRAGQFRVGGDELDASMARVVVEKETPGMAFASATWRFSTEELPAEASGDFFAVTRRFFKRVSAGGEWVLEPLAEGVRIEVGDQVEVELSIRARHAAEYVHLRDPRPAGFEPEGSRSGYRWDLGIGRYEEVRDSGLNFFFEQLPVGEYTLRHRLRASVSGVFKTAPAELQSMYAPEFSAYSAGDVIEIGRGR